MKRLVLICLNILVVACTFQLYAQSNITGRMITQIVFPITVMEAEPLNFGKIINGFEGGEVIISPTGTRESIGGVRGFGSDYYGAGKFIITSSSHQVMSITLPQGDQRLYSNRNSQSLIVRNFTTSVPSNKIQISNEDGRIELGIGASLFVSNRSSTPPGIYTGTYEIIFTYN